MCAQEPETADHLLLGCVVARQLWFALLSHLGLDSIVPRQDDALADWCTRTRKLLHSDARQTFDSAVLLTTWCVWKERNNRTFARTSPDLRGMDMAVLREAEDWTSAGFSPLNAVLSSWSQIPGVM